MYAKIVDNSVSIYPYFIENLKTENPTVSFPPNALSNASICTDYGIVSVTAVAHANKPGWIYTETTPVLDGATWKQTWSATAKNAADVSADEVTATTAPTAEGKLAVEGDPELDGDVWKQTWSLVDKTWLDNRADEYGSAFYQIEYISENGIAAWQTKVAEIKAKYPKS